MTENPTKLCRFCLHEEKCGDDSRVVDVFECGVADFPRKIINCVQIQISPDDKIPPNICRKCFDYIEEFSNYLDNCWKSAKVLEGIYNISQSSQLLPSIKSELSTNHISNEHVIESALTTPDANCGPETNSKIEDHLDDFADCDSNFSTIDEMRVIKKKRRSRKCLPSNGKSPSTKGRKSDQTVFKKRKFIAHDAGIKVTCDICNKKVLKKSLLAHLRKHTDRHKCDSCGSKHTSKAAMQKHFMARHAGIKGLVCHICGKQNSCQASMNRHLAYHSTARPYQCKYCHFSAKSTSTLNVHISRKHLAEQRICELCAKVFKSELSLKQHVKRMHNPRRYVCNICGKAFIENYNLNKHILSRHSKQRLYECKVCTQEFFTVKKLKEHMHSHRSGCVRCPNCSKEFFYKKYLEKHMAKCAPNLQGDYFNNVYRLKNTLSLPNSSVLYEK